MLMAKLRPVLYQSMSAASRAHKLKTKRMIKAARRTERRATTSDGERTDLGTAMIREEFGDNLMAVLERDRAAGGGSASEGGEAGENTYDFQLSDTRQPTRHTKSTSSTWSTTLEDMVEQEQRAQDQSRLGIRARKSKPPLVPSRGGQVRPWT